jgi:transposase-like protein
MPPMLYIVIILAAFYAGWRLWMSSRTPQCPQCHGKSGVSRSIGETYQCSPCKIRWNAADGSRLTYL